MECVRIVIWVGSLRSLTRRVRMRISSMTAKLLASAIVAMVAVHACHLLSTVSVWFDAFSNPN